MFDKLLLLASGNMVYSGPAKFTTDYLDSVDQPCPAGFNVADYLLDWNQEPQNRNSESGKAHLLTGISSMPSIGLSNSTLEGDLESQTEPNVWGEEPNSLGRMMTQEPGPIPTVSNSAPDDTNYLSNLVLLFKESDLYNNITTSIEGIKAQDNEDAQSTHSSIGRGYKRSSWFTQFKILSARTFKNLYRDPLLMLANYCMSVVLGLLCVLFHVCSIWIQLFDIISLRLIPPVLMGIIVYPMVGLNPESLPFFNFLHIVIELIISPAK